MDAVGPIAIAQDNKSGKLLKVLGVAFGLAVALGGTVGVGILRNPGGVAAELGSVWLIMFAWLLGGVYCLLSANFTAELATMIPKAGGFYVYAERALGRYGGFVVGWSDWMNGSLALAFISVVFGEYASALFAPDLVGARVIFSTSIVSVITIFHLIGVRAGSRLQQITSVLKAAALIGFVFACFVFGGQLSTATVGTAASSALPAGFSLAAFILAFQMVLSTYDGWYSPIYFSEEDTNPASNLPRSLFGGIILIAAIYILVNLALIYVLPMSRLAGSKFAGADALTLIFGELGGQILTVLALLSLIGIINALAMMQPRIMFALGRDGLFTSRAAAVNKGGTPVFALLMTAGIAILFSAVGSFEVLLGIATFFVATFTFLTIISLFILRRREPNTPRPFSTWGYPFAPLVMLVFAVLLLLGYIYSNPSPSLYALGLLAISYPTFRLANRAPV
jgi:basic amino acid/polyamine antiporter, APA family